MGEPLHRRFLAAPGYDPRLLQRMLCLRALPPDADRQARALTRPAFETGQAGQAQLSRGAQALAGMTFAPLRTARLQVRNVQDTAAGAG
jgi:hypothetical protein